MNLKKAIDKLRHLAENEPDDLTKYAKVHALLAAFKEENRDMSGAMIDAYSDERIGGVETYFAILCGIGEDGFTAKKARENLLSNISGLEKIIGSDDFSLNPPSAQISKIKRSKKSS